MTIHFNLIEMASVESGSKDSWWFTALYWSQWETATEKLDWIKSVHLCGLE